MRLAALTLALAVLAACHAAAIPSHGCGTTGAAAIARNYGLRQQPSRAPVDESERDEDSENETEDADDTDIELIAVLASEVPLTLALGSAQRWTQTHARASDDPDPVGRHRPPRTA